jgi:phosphatidylserine decarboxylase
MRIPLAKYGIKEIVISILVCGLLSLVLGYINGLLVLIPIGIILFVFYFFRNPVRHIPSKDNIILSPADGKIIEIREINDFPYIKGDVLKITIFLSVFNVHINRAPCSGRIVLTEYKKGQYLVASVPEASNLNESNTVVIDCTQPVGLQVAVKQITGIIARRIVCICRKDDVVSKGDEIGMIKFGSRTELFLLKERVSNVEIKMGDKVKGGETILCRIKS